MVLMLLTPLDVMPDFDYFIVFFLFLKAGRSVLIKDPFV